MDIKEIALRIGEEADEYADAKLQSKGEFHPNWHTVRDEYFAEALIAEIAKQNEPVAEVLSLFPGEPDSYINARAIGVDPFNTWTFPQPGTKLYTIPPTAEQIAAEQLNNKRLRDALNQWIGIAANCSIESGWCCCGDSIENHSHPMACGHSPVDMADSVVREAIDSTGKALSLTASTEALDAYVAEKVKDVQLQDIEQYLLQMAGISTAAIGYWKEDDLIPPAYDTPALRDVAKLYANYESRTRQRDLAVEELEQRGHSAGCRKNAFGDLCTCGLDETLVAIKESEAK